MGDLIKQESKKEKIEKYDFNDDEKELIKQTVARNQNLTDAELKLFGYVCKTSGLNPLTKQIYVVKFHNNQSDQNEITFITGIDGYRSIAERTGMYGGGDDYLFDEGLTMYEMLKKFTGGDHQQKVIPRTATCTVQKIVHGIRCPTTASVRWTERYPTSKKKQWFWNDNPFGQLGKCAEALALKRAFPNVYHGIYLDAEADKMGYRDTEESGDNIELVNTIYKMYDALNYNAAAIIENNTRLCEKARLENMTENELGMLETQLSAEIDKLNKGENDGKT